MTSQRSSESRHWLDDPKLGDRIFRGLLLLCGLLLVADLADIFLHYRHPHFKWEGLPGFYGVFGFSAFVVIVLSGKHLRKILMRDEDYYLEETPDAE